MSSTRPDIDVHPKARNIETLQQHDWDVIVLGGGPTGQTIAVRCAGSRLSVLLVERELAGGECQNWACVPSKALLRPLEVATDAASVGGTREMLLRCQDAAAVGGGMVDLNGLWAFRDRSAFNWNDEENAVLLDKMGVHVVHGNGSLLGPGRVRITGWHSQESREVTARLVVIATGSEPIVPPIEGLVEAGFWTPREAVSAREVPKQLIILGAGPVGSEFATVYAKLGSQVTLITTRVRILRSVPEKAAALVHQSLEKMGVDVKTCTTATKMRRDRDSVEISFSDGTTVRGSEVLLAAGRKPRTTGMGLAKFGLDEAAPLVVDEHMRVKAVTTNWLYALGDTNGISNTTHMGVYEATICAQHIISTMGKTVVPSTNMVRSEVRDCVPQTCFTEPQISFVGLSLTQALERGIAAKEVSVNTGGTGTHSYLYAENYTGWAQWVVEVDTGRILGAVFVGMGVANLLHASTVAIVGGMTWQQLLHAVPSFPTLSEAYNLLVQACLSTTWN